MINKTNLGGMNKKKWEIKKLGEVCEIINGRNQSKVKSETGKYPILGSAGKIMGFATDYICKEGTTIIGRKGNISNPIYIDKKFWNVDTAFGIYPKEGYDNKYIYYLCLTIDFESRNRGTTIPSLVKSDLLNINVNITTSLSDQQRVVSYLDQAFEAIDEAKTLAEKNLENAKELFESYLQDIFEKKGEGWVERKLGSCFKLRSGENLSSKEMIGEKYPVYGGNGIAGYHDKYNLSGSNVIIGRVGALCGNVRHVNENIWLTDNAFKIVSFQYEFDLKFLTYLLNIKDLRSYARQAAQPVISNSALKDVSLSFPISPSQQKDIAFNLDALHSEVQRLESIYEQKLADLEEMRQSVLDGVFR